MSIKQEIITARTPQTELPILESIKKRFSPRVFSSDPIPQGDLDICFEAARLTPSARNHQPWNFLVVPKGTPEYQKLFKACIPERNIWANTAPVIIVSCFDPTEPKDGVNRWATYDLGAAVMSFILQATELGYHCRQIGSFDIKETQSEFSIPEPFQPFVLIAMGKIGEEEDYKNADPEIIKKELEPHSRKPSISQKLTLAI